MSHPSLGKTSGLRAHPLPKINPLRKARIAAGLGIARLAKLAGVNSSTITRAESRGDWPPTKAQADALRRALGLTDSVKP